MDAAFVENDLDEEFEEEEEEEELDGSELSDADEETSSESESDALLPPMLLNDEGSTDSSGWESPGLEVTEGDRATLVVQRAAFPLSTTVSHDQCCDAVCPAGGSLAVLTRGRSLLLVDTTSGVTLCASPTLPFDVYSVTAAPERCWVVAVGNERGAVGVNACLLRLDAPPLPPSLRVVHAFGVGAVEPRFGGRRWQANSARFGWRANANADATTGASSSLPSQLSGSASPAPRAPPPPTRVLLVGSQDGSVHVLSVPDAGWTPPPQPPQQPPQPHAGASAGGARASLSQLRELASIPLPCAVNYAQSSPCGTWLAASGDREEVYFMQPGWGDPTREPPCLQSTLTFGGPEHETAVALRSGGGAGGGGADAQGAGALGGGGHGHRPAGCQYIAWSDDGTRLAASSDTLNCVCVWRVEPLGGASRGAEVVRHARFTHFPHPLLALSFLRNSHVLTWGALEWCVYACDVDSRCGLGNGLGSGALGGTPRAAAPPPASGWDRPLCSDFGGPRLRAAGLQRLRLLRARLRRSLAPPGSAAPAPPPLAPEEANEGGLVSSGANVTGLGVLEDGTIVVSLRYGLFTLDPITTWSREAHFLWPAGFKAAAREVLRGAAAAAAAGGAAGEGEATHAAPAQGEPPTGLASLPKELLLAIVARSAVPQSAWLPPRPAVDEEADALAEQGPRGARVAERLRAAAAAAARAARAAAAAAPPADPQL